MRIPLRAWFFPSNVDLRQVKQLFADCQLEQDDAALLTFSADRRVCVTSFGGVVFWPYDERLAREVTDRIKVLLDNPTLIEAVEDRLIVETDRGETRVLFNEVWLAGPATPGLVCLISELLAQSVALEHLEFEVDRALERFQPMLDQLFERGRVRAPQRRILQGIGFAMQTRYVVLNNLALFDRPESTWESEELAVLYPRLYELFELDVRQNALNRRLSFLSSNASLLSDLVSTQKGHRLEWIIIALIAFEIALALIRGI